MLAGFQPQPDLYNTAAVQANSGAFAALRDDGASICWGDPACGGQAAGSLLDIQAIPHPRLLRPYMRMAASALGYILTLVATVAVAPCTDRSHSVLANEATDGPLPP